MKNHGEKLLVVSFLSILAFISIINPSQAITEEAKNVENCVQLNYNLKFRV
jgi:hypothetical protein